MPSFITLIMRLLEVTKAYMWPYIHIFSTVLDLSSLTTWGLRVELWKEIRELYSTFVMGKNFWCETIFPKVEMGWNYVILPNTVYLYFLCIFISFTFSLSFFLFSFFFSFLSTLLSLSIFFRTCVSLIYLCRSIL